MCAGIIESWLTVPHGSTSLSQAGPSLCCVWVAELPPKAAVGGGREQELSSSTQWEPGILPTPPLPRGVRPQSLQFPEPGGSGLPNVPSCPGVISFPVLHQDPLPRRKTPVTEVEVRQ